MCWDPRFKRLRPLAPWLILFVPLLIGAVTTDAPLIVSLLAGGVMFTMAAIICLGEFFWGHD